MATGGRGATFVAQGVGAQLVVTPTHVIFRRRELGGGDTAIPMDRIAAVQLKKPGGLGPLTPGYLRLVLVGEPDAKGYGAFDAMRDERAVLIATLRRYADFVRAKDLIEQYRTALHGPTGAGG